MINIQDGDGKKQDKVQAPVFIKDDNIIHDLEKQFESTIKNKKLLVKHLDIFYQVIDIINNLEINIYLDNRVKMIPSYVEYLVSKTAAVLTPEQREGVKLGLSEILLNSIEHGNLDIGYERKSKALENGVSDLLNLYQERSQKEPYCSRQVFVNYKITDKYCEWIIQDQGKGFNWEEHLNENSFLEDFHGMGIFLCKNQFDEIEYFGNGNKVRLRKNIVMVG